MLIELTLENNEPDSNIINFTAYALYHGHFKAHRVPWENSLSRQKSCEIINLSDRRH